MQRSVNRDALELARAVDDYLEEIRPALPQNLTLEVYDIQSDLIKGRMNLLLRNGLGGLVLVLAVLFVFLNTRRHFLVTGFGGGQVSPWRQEFHQAFGVTAFAGARAAQHKGHGGQGLESGLGLGVQG